MKRYLLMAAAVVAAILAGGIAFLSGRADSFRPKIQSDLQDKLKRPVTLGHLGLKLFPLSLEIQGFSVGEDAAFATGRPFATASQVSVSAELFTLLMGNPQVKEVILDQPQIELIRNAAGQWNFSSLGGESGRASKFALDKLEIKNGKVALADALHQPVRSIYDHIDLTVNDFSREKAFALDLGVHLPGEGKQLAEFKGKAGPLALSLPPVKGHLSLEQVSLAAISRFAAGALPADTDAVLSGSTDLDTGDGKVSAQGELALAHTVIRGAKLDYAIQAKYKLSADQAFDRVAIQSMNLVLGNTTLAASGSVDNAARPAILDVRLITKDSSLRELAKLAGAAGVAFNPDYKIDGRLSLDVSAKGPANDPRLNGNITLKNVSASGGQMKDAVSTPEIDLALTPESIVTNTFTAKSGATALDVSLTLMNYGTPDLAADVTLRTANARMADLLNIARAYGVSATGGVSGNGMLTMDLHAHGDVAHPVLQFALAVDRIDTEELASVRAETSAKGPSLLETMLKNATGGGTLSVSRIQAQQIALSAVSATAKLDHGVIALSPLSADLFQGKISGAAAADVRPKTPDCSLDAKLTGVDANALLSAVSSMKNELYGNLGARTHLKFALASGGDLARTLNGTVDFALANGELKNVNILSEASKFLNLLDGKGAAPAGGNSTQLKQFSGTLTIANGVATTNNLKAATDSGSIAAKGSLNLVSEAVDLHMTVGTGFLAMPVLVTGTTAHMRFAPDLEALAKMKLRGVLGSIFGDRGDRGQKKQ